jgi:class 3 adenylate cyclase
LLTWAYEKSGTRYPALFLAVELQSAWLIAFPTLGVFSLYYNTPIGEYYELALVVLGLTALVIGISLFRALRFMKPIGEWIGSPEKRSNPVLATRAWETAVGVPTEVAVREMVWPVIFVAIPGLVGSIIVFDFNPLSAIPLMAGSLIAIAYGGVLHYFGLETGMRPVLKDINRQHAPWANSDIQVLSLRVKLMASLPLINVIAGLTAAALSGGGGGGASLGADVLIAIGVAVAVSLVLTFLLASSVLRPINDIEEGIEAVREGRFGVTVPVTTPDEIGHLSAAFNQMSQGLAERERIRAAFGTYLDRNVADHILNADPEAGGIDLDVSLLFCDVRGFTEFAATSDARHVVASLNRLFEAVVPIIASHGGHVNKFIGDGLLAVFGAPESHADHAERAVRCAIAMAQRVNHGGSGLLGVGIGVNSGRVVAGSIGGAGRLDYSVIGDAVNVASRVEKATRDLDNEILITEETRQQVGQAIELEDRGLITLRGKPDPVRVWAPVVETAERHLPANTTVG